MKKNKLLMYQNLTNIELDAKAKLSKKIYDFYAGGSGDEITLCKNRQDFANFQLVPKILAGVQQSNLQVKIFGKQIELPILAAPMGLQKLAHPQGEIAVAQGLKEVGSIFICSSLSSFSLEEISKETSGILWFQMYVFKDRAITQDLLQRAEKSGYQAIVLTVDVPIMGYRERDQRNQFILPKNIKTANLIPYQSNTKILFSKSSGSSIKVFTDDQFLALTWKDVEWLKSQTKLPIILKGILRGSDAVKAIDYGVDGIIVSNHGGRQLDGVCSSIEALPLIVKQVQSRIPILMDGGIRRGLDVLKALALGCDGVLLGRPIIWGLATAGQEGVVRVLQILQRELRESMILCGYHSIADLKKDAAELLINAARVFKDDQYHDNKN